MAVSSIGARLSGARNTCAFLPAPYTQQRHRKSWQDKTDLPAAVMKRWLRPSSWDGGSGCNGVATTGVAWSRRPRCASSLQVIRRATGRLSTGAAGCRGAGPLRDSEYVRPAWHTGDGRLRLKSVWHGATLLESELCNEAPRSQEIYRPLKVSLEDCLVMAFFSSTILALSP